MELDLSIGHATTNYLTSSYLHYIFFLSQASSLEMADKLVPFSEIANQMMHHLTNEQ